MAVYCTASRIHSVDGEERLAAITKRKKSVNFSEDVELLQPSSSAKESTPYKIDQNSYFLDGVTVVDFVLTFKGNINKDSGERNTFLTNCDQAGFKIEYQPSDGTKIKELSAWEKCFKKRKIPDPFSPYIPKHLEEKEFYTTPFLCEKKDKHMNCDDEKNFFTASDRAAIVNHILQATPYGDDFFDVGLDTLIQQKTFSAAFPLHESIVTHKGLKPEDMNTRQSLYYNWCRGRSWLKWQPISQVREYFGAEVAVYFNLLGLYTIWLIPAAIVGLAVLLAGILLVGNESIVQEICDPKLRYQFYLCPSCDAVCDFEYGTSSCIATTISKVFYFEGTVFFSVFMSFWGVLFLEFWKRNQYILKYKWNVNDYETIDEGPRPQYMKKMSKLVFKCGSPDEIERKYVKKNLVLNTKEYMQSNQTYLLKTICSICILTIMIIISIGIVTAVALAQQAASIPMYRAVGVSIGRYAITFISAIFQFTIIELMSKINYFIAYKLNVWELYRTQSEFDHALTIKVFIFEFANYSAPLIYTAFIKGNVSGHPGAFPRIASNIRVSDCGASDCILDLTIYILIFLLGRAYVHYFTGLRALKTKLKRPYRKNKKYLAANTKWEMDNELAPAPPVTHPFFSDYLDLVIQFGLLTIFAILPIGPLLALINNVVKIRGTATKYVIFQRRVVANRASSIGLWKELLTGLSKLAVMMNVVIIAFSTDFVPRMVYLYGGFSNRSSPNSFSGFVNWTYGSFPVHKLLDGSFPAFSSQRLPLYNGSELLQEDGKNFLYLPFIDFQCLTNESGISFPLRNFSNIIGLLEHELNGGVYSTLREDDYLRLVVNDNEVRNHILKSETSEAPLLAHGKCFKRNVQCRFLTFATEGRASERFSLDGEGRLYWTIQSARISFILVFEHFVFVTCVIIDYIIPDIPLKIKQEISRRKLLAYAALISKDPKEISSCYRAVL